MLNGSDFLLQKLYSYREALNLRGVMAPLVPLFLPPMQIDFIIYTAIAKKFMNSVWIYQQR